MINQISSNSKNSLRKELQLKIKNNKTIYATYLTLGYPDLETSIEAMIALGRRNVDIIEIGVPFSDPIADGPIIQNSSEFALENNIRIDHLWPAINELKRKTNSRIVCMTYGNLIMQFGYSKFNQISHQVGLDGLIIPDIPYNLFPEELTEIDPIFLVSANLNYNRIYDIINNTCGFIYLVSRLGTTGHSLIMDSRNKSIIEYINSQQRNLPKLIGFGINSISNVNNALEQGADGVIIGSALIKALGENGDIDNMINEFDNLVVN